MKIALGLKAHSGWAILVALGAWGAKLQVTDRRRVELVGEDEHWAKQPFHAAEGLAPEAAKELIQRGIEAARRNAVTEIRARIERAREAGHRVTACAVLMGEPMPEWTVEEILAVHFRMHKAEGALFRHALVRAAEECGLKRVLIPEKLLHQHSEDVLRVHWKTLGRRIEALGKSIGSPWGKDYKDAALAAMVALGRTAIQEK